MKTNIIDKRVLISVAPYENEAMSWGDATNFARLHGMRLPTRGESQLIVENRFTLFTKIPAEWWTSEKHSEENAEVWSMLDNGKSLCDSIDKIKGVILVKTLDRKEQFDKMDAQEMVNKLRELGYTVKCTKTTTIEL